MTEDERQTLKSLLHVLTSLSQYLVDACCILEDAVNDNEDDFKKVG